jgi:hypothetical protein
LLLRLVYGKIEEAKYCCACTICNYRASIDEKHFWRYPIVNIVPVEAPDCNALTAYVPQSVLTLDTVIASWLHAKITRTNSAKTKVAYTEHMADFRATLQSMGLDLDSNPLLVATAAQAWIATAHRKETVAAATQNFVLSSGTK